MEFLSNFDGPVLLNPEEPVTDEDLERTQAATDFFVANAERMLHFKRRAEELGRTGRDTVITLIDVDDPVGGVLAGVLMPGYDWQANRDAGTPPVASGLAAKDGMRGLLQAVGYELAAGELIAADDLRVVVVSSGRALVLEVDFDEQAES